MSFLFGGISVEYDGSVSSLTHIISSYLALNDLERPFIAKNLYHLSRDDGLVRTIPLHDAFTIADLQSFIFDHKEHIGHPLISALDSNVCRGEYIVNLLHGQFGEDGGAQTLATLLGLRGTFGDPNVASLTMDKYAMSAFVSSHFTGEGLKVPITKFLPERNGDNWRPFARAIKGPIVVKPNSLGSSLFAKLFDNATDSEAEIDALLRTIFRYDSAALIQEFVPGDEYTCGCILSASEVIPLPVVKIDADMQFFGRDQKYSGKIARKCIVRSEDALSKRLQAIAKSLASSLPFYNMVRFDFRVCDNCDVWFLECNYIPGLDKDGSFDRMLGHFGMSVVDLISWIAVNATPFAKKDHYIEYESL
ncbi:ATP-grasp domain-containing protein [Mesorhizobium sp. VK9D]|nr:ATP-grasp domain-containing protein [Mesorhizobium sp. VK9D]